MENHRNWANFVLRSILIMTPNAAHAADYDVDVMMQCFFAGLDRGFYKIV